jgi:ATP-dependent DNA ligase
MHFLSGKRCNFAPALTSIGSTTSEAVRDLAADEALIEGEAVALRDDGRSDFQALLTKRGGVM